MDKRWLLLPVVVSLSAVPTTAATQSFEGTIRHRTIEVGEEALAEVLYADDVEEPEFDSEQEWLSWVGSHLFELPVERFVAGGVADVTETTTWVKGDHLRADVSEMTEGGYTIYDGSSGEMFMVDPAGRWYVRLSREELGAAADEAMREAEEMAARMGVDLEEMRRMAEDMDMMQIERDALSATVREVSGTRTIAGLGAVGREVVTSEDVTLAWCAAENPEFADAVARLSEQLGFAEEDEDEYGGTAPEDLACEERMPLLVQTYSLWAGAMGGESYTIEELIAIERAPVDDAMFEIPDGYTERAVSDLWRMRGEPAP